MTVFFPNTVVDGFFENPDAVVSFANKQKFFRSEDGRWPGERTKLIHELDSNFFSHLCSRMFGIFYDISQDKVEWNVSACFQKVNKNYQDGWIHRDNAVCTAIIYLSKNAPLNSGTSLYRLKPTEYESFNPYEDVKRKSYLGLIPPEESKEARSLLNNKFEETLNVKNVYNRLFLFDAYQHHKANDFELLEGEDERLTLVAFVRRISCDSYLSSRMRLL